MSRPLKIKFASVEERERIGKRRRIIKDDQRRQAISGSMFLPSGVRSVFEEGPDRYKNLELGPLEDIDIRINGQQFGKSPLCGMPKFAPSLQSSETMLLDREEIAQEEDLVNSKRLHRKYGKTSRKITPNFASGEFVPLASCYVPETLFTLY
jgi:hypothetical protein